MSDFIVIREYRGPIASKLQTFPEGKVLSSDEYDIERLQAAGVRMVPFTAGLLDRILTGDKRPGSALAALVGDGGVTAVTIHVDGRTTLSASSQDGSNTRPFKTIAQAVAALPPAATTGAERRLNHRDIWVENADYDEHVDIDITGRGVRIVSLGTWRLGLFDDFAWNQSGTRRNITISGSTDTVDGIQSYFSICNTIEVGNRGLLFGLKATVPRISGKISYSLESPGTGGPQFIGQLLTHIEAEVQGDTGDATGISIETLQPELTLPRVFLSLDKSFIAGKIVLDPVTGDIFSMEGTRLRGDVIADTARYVRLCQCEGDWTITALGLLTPVRGFIECTFEGQFDGVSGTNMEVDAYTAYRMDEVGATVINGERKVLSAGTGGTTLIAGQTYTVLPSDNNKVLQCTNALAVTLSIDTGDLPLGFACTVVQWGAGQVDVGGGTATIRRSTSVPGTKTASQFSRLDLAMVITDELVLSGDASA